MEKGFAKTKLYPITPEQVKKGYEENIRRANSFCKNLSDTNEIVNSSDYDKLLKQPGIEKALKTCYETFGDGSFRVIEAYFESKSRQTFAEWLNRYAKLAIYYMKMNS